MYLCFYQRQNEATLQLLTNDLHRDVAMFSHLYLFECSATKAAALVPSSHSGEGPTVLHVAHGTAAAACTAPSGLTLPGEAGAVLAEAAPAVPSTVVPAVFLSIQRLRVAGQF